MEWSKRLIKKEEGVEPGDQPVRWLVESLELLVEDLCGQLGNGLAGSLVPLASLVQVGDDLVSARAHLVDLFAFLSFLGQTRLSFFLQSKETR